MEYSYTDLLFDLFNKEDVWAAVEDTCYEAWKIAMPIASMCFLAHVGYLYLTSAIKGFDWRELLSKMSTSVFFIFLLTFYQLWVPPIIGLMRICAEETAPTLDKKKEYYDKVDAMYKKKREENVKNTGLVDTVKQVGSDIASTLSNITNGLALSVIDAIVLLLLTVAEAIIFMFSLLTMYIFYIVGPLALAFSILPMFRDKANIWLGTMLTAGFNLTTLNIIDHFFWNVTVGQVAAAANFEHVNLYMMLCINIVIIVLYCMSFWLTSRYVGSESAGKILSTAAGAATTAMGMLAGGAALAKAGGGSGAAGGLADNVAKTGSESLKN